MGSFDFASRFAEANRFFCAQDDKFCLMNFPLMKIFRAAVLAAVACCGIAVAGQVARGCAAAHYKIVELPFHPARINDAGVVAGTTEDHQAATWNLKGGLRVIALPTGFAMADALGINSSGDVVGVVAREKSEQPIAFAYVKGKFSLLSESRSKAFGINDAGDIVGQSAEKIFVWRKQKPLDLGGCCGGIPHDISNHGVVVGQINDKTGHYSAFEWDAARGMRSIAPPKTASSFAVAINGKGHVLLKVFTPNAVFLRREGKLTEVKLSPEFASQALAFNDCDVIVGEFGASSEWNHAFIWDEAHGFRNLNTLADVGSEWNLETALSINDRGEIVGIGDRASAQDVGYLLIPDAPTGTSK
jgi:uncharacterized membrane protein